MSRPRENTLSRKLDSRTAELIDRVLASLDQLERLSRDRAKAARLTSDITLDLIEIAGEREGRRG